MASLFSTYGQQTQAAVEQHAMVGTEQFAHGIASAASSYSGAQASISWLLNQFQGARADLEAVVTFFVHQAQTDPILFVGFLAFLALNGPIVIPFAIAAGGIFILALIVIYVAMGRIR